MNHSTCRRALVSDQLTAATRSHIEACPACTAFASALDTVVTMAPTLAPAAPAQGTLERVLESVATASSSLATTKPARRPWRRLRVPRFGPLAVAAAVAVAVAVIGGTVSHVWQRSVAPRESNANPPRIVTTTLGVAPTGIAFTQGAAWIYSTSDSVVLRVDTTTHRVTQTIPAGLTPTGISAAEGFLWVTSISDNHYLRVDPRTGSVAQRDQHGGAKGPAMVTAGSVWLYVAESLLRIDEQTGRVLATIPMPSRITSGVFGADSLWMGGYWDVARVDPRTGTVSAVIPIATPAPNVLGEDSAFGFADNALPAGAGFGSVWVVDRPEQTLSRIDPATNKVIVKIKLPHARPIVAIGTDAIWVADSTKTIERIDPVTYRVTNTITVNSSSDAIAFQDGSLWLLNTGLHTLTRVQT